MYPGYERYVGASFPVEALSFVLVDEDKETLCDLYLVDDETVIVDGELLKGLDEDLDDFLKKLLEE